MSRRGFSRGASEASVTDAVLDGCSQALAQTGVTSKAFAAWRWALSKSLERSVAAEAHGRRLAASSGLRRWRAAVADAAQWRMASRVHERAGCGSSLAHVDARCGSAEAPGKG